MNQRIAIGMVGVGFAVALAVTSNVSYADTVGAAAAVRPSSTGTPPGGSARTLEVGTKIVSKERIRTTGSGSLQVMFNDKSTMTVGPNSDLVIDQFVYNPGSGGSFATNLTKGALRFVGGQISHKDGAKITTPVATLVVRGGAAMVSHDASCAATASGSARQACTKAVCTGGNCTVTTRSDRRTFRLKVNQAIEVGLTGAVEFDVRSVSLSDVAKGGDGGLKTGKKAGGTAKFTGKSTIDDTIVEQSPEPPPPAPPR